MLVQLLKICENSAWNSPEDIEKYEGKIFYAKDKSQIQMIYRKWRGLPNVGYLSDVELIIHKDLKPLYFLDKYSFYNVEYKILRM